MSEAMAQDLWVLKDIGEEWEIERPATISDLVSAVQAYGVGEVVQWCSKHRQSAMASAPWKCHLGEWISICEVAERVVLVLEDDR